MNEIDIAWAAGVFDGEGTFQIAKDGRGSSAKYYARMRIGMCHLGAIERFAKIADTGAIVGENTPAANSNYVQYRWSASGLKAIKVAKMLRPYLTVKQHEADILIEWEPLMADGRKTFLTPEINAKRAELYEQMMAARSRFLTPIPGK